MKHLKRFENFEYDDPEIESELGSLPYENEEISKEDFKDLCEDALKLNDIDQITKVLVRIRKAFDPNSNPELKDMWWGSLKRWRGLFATLGEPSPNLIGRQKTPPSPEDIF